MTSAESLESAILLRDRIRQIDQFLRGYEDRPNSEAGWRGFVTLTFGSYHCEVDDVVRGDAIDMLKVQRARYVLQLEGLGVGL